MERHTPPLLPTRETQILALCEDHLTQEEALLADLLQSLRQVREAFFQRNLHLLPALQSEQTQLTSRAAAMTAVRECVRAMLAELLALPAGEATLHAAAQALPELARGRLLQRQARLRELVREVDQLSQQNAALFGYARGFFAALFAGLAGTSAGERYGPQGERHDGLCGSFLEARV